MVETIQTIETIDTIGQDLNVVFSHADVDLLTSMNNIHLTK